LNPRAFDASKGLALDDFLFLASWRNVTDTLRSSRRRSERERRYAAIASRRPRAPTEHVLLSRVFIRRVLRQLPLQFSCPMERQALRAWLAGEDDTDVIAGLLGESDPSVENRRRHVKRFKDRVRKRVRRFIASQDYVRPRSHQLTA
jgi:hypothetical protein